MKLRFERKYLVPNDQLSNLRRKLMPFILPDKMAQSEIHAFPEYTVRSIYFDSPTYNSYYEKIEGLKDRKKLRIRGYNNYEAGCKVFLEIKRKLGNNIAKNRCLVDYDSIEQFLETGDIEKYLPLEQNSSLAQDEAKKFFFYLKRFCQVPVNLVVYEREPYHGRFDPGVRITFDKNIRAATNPQICDLFMDKDLAYIWEKHFVLEIKYFTREMPRWARSLVEEFELDHSAISKYSNGLDKPLFVFH